MSNENLDKQEEIMQQTSSAPKKEERQFMRRQSDVETTVETLKKTNDINAKLLGQLKFSLMIILFIVIIFWQTIAKDTTNQDYQIRLLNDILVKIEQLDHTKLVKSEDNISSDKTAIERIVSISVNTKQCAACHNNNNVIRLYPSWNYEDFKNYIRGIKRIPNNDIMPKYDTKTLTDKEIELIYLNLLQSK